MPDSLRRQEILDLLSRGKIRIDEAADLLSHSGEIDRRAEDEETVYKAEVIGDLETAGKDANINGVESVFKEADPDQTIISGHSKKSRWLRVRVADLGSGKNKVSINVPFAMVKFGLGIARVFSPEKEGANLDEISDMFSSMESGLLVGVEDVESNEHVQIYLD